MTPILLRQVFVFFRNVIIIIDSDLFLQKVIITGHEDILLFKARRLPSAMGSMPRELLLYDDDGSTQLIVVSIVFLN